MAKTVQRLCRIAEAGLSRVAMPMFDPRRTRQFLIFLGNAASGVVAVVVTFFGVILTDKAGPLAPVLALVMVPALATSIWRSDLKLRGREPDLTKRVGWQVFWVLIAWDAVGIALAGFFVFFALSAMAPVPHSHDTAGVLALIVISVAFVLALWFTRVRSRRMVDLLWPLPGMPERGAEKTSSRRNFWRNLLISAAVVICVLFLAALFIPTLDGPNTRRRANEAVAVGSLRRITALQNEYAASHSTKGFACQLPLLKAGAHNNEGYDSDALLLTEEHVGYRIAFVGCEPEPNGVVTRYRIAAVPLEPGKSGVQAFCIDETGSLWYDASGSAENCLASRRTID
jgi:hypothetical protein